MTLTAKDLKEFEDNIADIYKQGLIPYPVHLRKSQDSSYENNLIKIYNNIKEEDYVFGFWAMHAHCLLKGVPHEDLKQAIIDGKSISLCFPEKNIYCSGIVSSLTGVAVGTAFALQKQNKNGRVYLHIGDMASQNGSFYEAVKYAWSHVLPIHFIVEDNGLSVMTDTENTWGLPSKEIYEMLNEYYPGYITYFKYKNEFPHSGLKERIKF